MLTHAAGLSPDQLDAIADLQQRVVAADGGRLKLEWSTLRERAGDRVEDVLAWEAGRLVGFLGSYAFGGDLVELAGMVDPAARRRGTGGALLDAALALCAGRGCAEVLLVTPGDNAGARGLALSRGGVPHHSEHALVLTARPAPGARDPALRLRAATTDDAAGIARLLAAGFGGTAEGLLAQVRQRLAATLVAEHDGTLVSAVRAERDGDAGDVHGFVVDPARQGRGIGREVLRRVCEGLLDDGASSVGLEVATDNERALGLYTSLGFRPVTVEDYFAVPTTLRRA